MSHPSLVRRALPCALALSLGAGLLIGPASPAAAAIVPVPVSGSVADPSVTLTPVATYESGVFGESAAEIVTHYGSKIFTVNALDGTVDVLDAAPAALEKSATLSLVGAPVVGGGTVPAGSSANSLVVRADGLGVVAVQNPVKTDAGWLVAFDANTNAVLSAVTVGALPDMVTLTEDGGHALIANEGEPSDDYTVDPEGSVAIVTLPATVEAFGVGVEVRTADFHDFEVGGRKRAAFDERTRVFGPQIDSVHPVSANLEPEYISVSGGKAYVALQEANAIGVLDIASAEFERIWSLGLKDHSLEQNALTTSNQANRIDSPRNDARLLERHTYENLSGLYMPDGIDTYTVGGETYLVTANEGDAREWGEYIESVRVADLAEDGKGPVCAGVFSEQELSAPYLGRLNVSIESPFDEAAGCYTELHAFGGRSFSIYTADGTQVFDSGDDFERITAEVFPEGFNTTNDENTLGNRNDDKGPEPENVTIAQLEGRTYAFIGLERVGGIMAYDITDPAAAEYVSYVNNRDFSADVESPAAGDLGPEGVHFIPAGESVTGRPMLAVGNETSGTTTLFDIETSTTTIRVLGINDFHGRISADPGSGMAGAAALAGAVSEIRAEHPNTLFVSAGDAIGGSTYVSSSQQDNPTIDALVAAGLDAGAVGNHEFDRGIDDLLDRVVPRYGDGRYALGANVYAEGTEEPLLDEYSVREIDGVRIGVIGTVTQATATAVSPAGIEGVEFGDPVVAANRVADLLTDGIDTDENGEADVIVLLTHEGSEATTAEGILAADDAFTRIVTETSASVDAIVSAHTHAQYNVSFPVEGRELDRPVIQSGQYGGYLDQLQFQWDREAGELVDVRAELLPLTGGDPVTTLYPAVPEVAEIVAAAEAQAAITGSVEIGSISADITRARTASGAEDRGAESSLGNLVADIQLWATSENPEYGGAVDSQIAIMNPGGVRADLLYGAGGRVTVAQVAEVQPFANSLFTMDLTGQQLQQLLEEQWQPQGASRPFLHLGLSANVDYVVDRSAAPGERILSVSIDGVPVADEQVVRVTTNSFLASGGDSFSTFTQGTQRADSGIVDLDATLGYFRAVEAAGGVVDPAEIGRAVEHVPGIPNPGTPGTGAEKPSSAPVAVSDAALTPAFEDVITSDDRSLSAGETIRVFVGVQYAAQWVQVWLHSEPVLLGGGWLQVAADGYVTVELPDELPAGAHRLVVLDAEGNVIGWQSVSVADTGVAALPDTGAQGVPVLVFGSLMLAAGLVLVVARRRAAQPA